MGWFNYYGLIIMAIIMIPNIISALTSKTAYENRVRAKQFEITEQIGRYGCFAFMIFNIPYTYFGFWFNHALAVYLVVNSILLAIYCLGWILKKNNRKIFMLWLSVTPSVIFLFSGIVLSSVPLIVFAVLFGIGYIAVSYINGV